jgi:hypothetical protein
MQGKMVAVCGLRAGSKLSVPHPQHALSQTNQLVGTHGCPLQPQKLSEVTPPPLDIPHPTFLKHL